MKTKRELAIKALIDFDEADIYEFENISDEVVFERLEEFANDNNISTDDLLLAAEEDSKLI